MTAKVDLEMLDRAAIEVYRGFVLANVKSYTPEQLARKAYQHAYPFAVVSQQVHDGMSLEDIAPEDDGLDYASAPNLDRNSPLWDKFNKGTKRFGADGRKLDPLPSSN